MKLSELKKVVKDAVKEAIQEEMKDILLEAVRTPKHTIYENNFKAPTSNVASPSPMNPVMQTSIPQSDRMAMRENIQSVLGSMMPGANGTLNVNTNNMPLQVNSNMDTTSPNGSLPAGEVNMDQIMSLMSGKI